MHLRVYIASLGISLLREKELCIIYQDTLLQALQSLGPQSRDSRKFLSLVRGCAVLGNCL